MDKEKQSIKIIQNLYDPRKRNILAFSGGKDSIVLYRLVQKAGVDVEKIYSDTTIDPPGHVNFIKRNYSDVHILKPKKSFYKLIIERGLPTRKARFCCQYLKENVGNDGNSKVIEGLRFGEGVTRDRRLKKLKEPESCDNRKKGNKIHVYPILNWTEQDVWDYIHQEKLEYPRELYAVFGRLGCMACPLVTMNKRIREYQFYPNHLIGTLKAIRRNISKGKSLAPHFENEYDAFMWWIANNKTINDYKYGKTHGFFKPDYKSEVETLLKMKL